MAKSKKDKIICPTCKGNGFVRVPYKLAKEEVHTNCGVWMQKARLIHMKSIILLLMLMVFTGCSKHMDVNPWTTVAKEILLNGSRK